MEEQSIHNLISLVDFPKFYIQVGILNIKTKVNELYLLLFRKSFRNAINFGDVFI